MPIQLSERASSVQPSATMALNTKAAQLRKSGKDIINFSAGEPDFDTPTPVKEACIEAIHANQTRYSPVTGILALRQAICDRLSRDSQLTYTPEEIIVSNGAKQSLYNATQAILNPGDHAIIPAPYWVSYPAMVGMAGAESIIISTSEDTAFKITAEQLETTITPKTRLLFLNSPSNPTGMIYTKEELQALAEVLLKYPQIAILSDDIYDQLTWTGEPTPHLLHVCPELHDRTILINGCSKTYAMTGWRIGYTAAPAPITGAMKKIQSHSTSGPNTMAQFAAVASQEMPISDLTTMLEAYQSRLTIAHSLLNQIPGVSCLPAQGAFYLFPSVRGLMETTEIDSDTALAERLLTECHLAAVPGSAFGANGYLRISCACGEAVLRDGISRIHAWAEERNANA